MGDPKYSRKVWRKPKRPLDYNLMVDELKTLGNFGLRTKRELWKARTELSRLRQQARSLLALGQEIRKQREPILLNSLAKIGLIKSDASLDDVLNLQINDVLARRLQSFVMKKMDFKTPYQARQAVTHGHIMIGQRIINIPSYTVTVDEENDVRLVPGSTLEAVLAANKKSEEEKAEKIGTTDADGNVLDDGGVNAGATDGLQKAKPVDHSIDGHSDESKAKTENIPNKDTKNPDIEQTTSQTDNDASNTQSPQEK